MLTFILSYILASVSYANPLNQSGRSEQTKMTGVSDSADFRLIPIEEVLKVVERLLSSERVSYAAYPDLDIYEKKMTEIFEERKNALMDLKEVMDNLEVETLLLIRLAKFESRLLRERASLTPSSGVTHHRVSIKLVDIGANASPLSEYSLTQQYPILSSIQAFAK